MTDPNAPYEPTPDELLAAAARADTRPPTVLPSAQGLPADVRNGDIDPGGHDEDDPGIQEEPVTKPKEV